MCYSTFNQINPMTQSNWYAAFRCENAPTEYIGPFNDETEAQDYADIQNMQSPRPQKTPAQLRFALKQKKRIEYLVKNARHTGERGGRYYIRSRADGTTYRSYT